jgi:hypothetical protein
VIDWIAADWMAPTSIIAGTTLRTMDASSLPVLGTPCWINQVHGVDVVTAAQFTKPPKADGSVSGPSKQFCVVQTADCLPVLFCSRDGNTFAAAHAGWRGLAAGILENTIDRMAVDVNELVVWLGPAISQPSFEVGNEVRSVFMKHDLNAEACFLANSRGRWQGDLYALARQRLIAAGISEISGGGFCTYLDENRFYSYRRDPTCGRMVSFVGPRT